MTFEELMGVDDEQEYASVRLAEDDDYEGEAVA